MRALISLSFLALALSSGCREPACEGGLCGTIGDASTSERREAGVADAGLDGGTGFDDAAVFEDATPGADARPPPDAGPPPDTGTSFSVSAGDPARTLLRGTVVTMDNGVVHQGGEVYVDGSRIRCVGPAGACAGDAAGATIIDTGGLILPGLVDAHNHVAYDWMPEWVSGRLWDDSPQWRRSAAYSDFIEPYRANSGDTEKLCAMVQWGELRALFHGTTTIFGTGQPRTCFRWLVRNAELTTGYSGFPTDAIRANTLGIDTVTTDQANTLRAGMDAGEIAAYVIHLAEGLTRNSHDEYLQLKALDLLREETVIIHGTALTAADFTEVAAAGAKLVWSPSSNYVLYGDTTDVAAAVNAGVSVSLAPDWTISGADELFGELRWARQWLDDNHPGLLDDRRLVEMVSVTPAEQLGLRDQVGRIAPGLLADLLVLATPGRDPHREVIEARPEQVRLVMLDGAPSYGDAALVQLLPGAPGMCYEVDACGAIKRACWSDTPVGSVSPSSIGDVIRGFHAPGPLSFFDCR